MKRALFLLASFLAVTLIAISCEQQGCEPPQPDATNGGLTVQDIGMWPPGPQDSSDTNGNGNGNDSSTFDPGYWMFDMLEVYMENELKERPPTCCDDFKRIFDKSWAYGQAVSNNGGDVSAWIEKHELLVWAYGATLEQCTAGTDVEYLVGPGFDSD